MDLKGAHIFLQSLDARIQALGIETNYIEGIRSPQIGDTLRILMAVTEEGNAVITEFMLGELAEDYDILVIYTTVLTKLGARKGELAEKLLEWNMICPLGHFGIFEEEQQLYHKYSVPFPVEIAPEKLAEQAMDLLSLVFELLSDKYPELAEYAAGEELPEE